MKVRVSLISIGAPDLSGVAYTVMDKGGLENVNSHEIIIPAACAGDLGGVAFGGKLHETLDSVYVLVSLLRGKGTPATSRVC